MSINTTDRQIEVLQSKIYQNMLLEVDRQEEIDCISEDNKELRKRLHDCGIENFKLREKLYVATGYIYESSIKA